MRIKNFLLSLFCVVVFITFTANAQTGINTTSPDPNAVLDVVSTSKGILIPRLSNTQVTTLEGTSPAKGMLIYNTNKNCLQIYSGTSFECTDISNDAWKDDDANNRVELAYKAGGAARGSGTEVVIKDNGRLGLGNVNPDQKLSIGNGNISVVNGQPNIFIKSNLANRYTRITFQQDDLNLGGFQLIGTGFTTANRRGNLEIFTTVSGNDIAFITNGVNERIRIKSTGEMGIGTNNPQATLDIRDPKPSSPSASAGIAVPQISKLPTSGNRAGQVVYHTANNKFYYYDGSAWQCLDCNAFNGDVKHSFATSDHNGWVLLDGRAISSLPSNQQTKATALGFSGNLPNATDRVLKKKGTIGSTGGSNSVTLAKANLPNVTFTGTTNAAGEHNHSFGDRGSGFFNNRDLNSGSLDIVRNSELSNTTNDGGEHSHTVSVSSGGSGTAVAVENPYLSVNTFIYLGL